MKKIAEGAEAEIYQTELFGISAIIKARVSKAYREKVLDEEIRAQRTKSEARAIAKASYSGANTPKVLMISKYQIFMNRIDGVMLNTVPEKMSGSIIRESARQISVLHTNDIIHGDYTPANVLVDKKGKVWIIDFGLSELSNSIEGKALDLLLMKRSISKKLYTVFYKAYLKEKYKDRRIVLNRLAEIEKRGRYQTRTLISKA